jgi:hypothetical protein
LIFQEERKRLSEIAEKTQLHNHRIHEVKQRKQQGERMAIESKRQKANEKLNKAQENKSKLLQQKQKQLDEQKQRRLQRLEVAHKKRQQQLEQQEKEKKALQKKLIKDDLMLLDFPSSPSTRQQTKSLSKYQASPVCCRLSLCDSHCGLLCVLLIVDPSMV